MRIPNLAARRFIRSRRQSEHDRGIFDSFDEARAALLKEWATGVVQRFGTHRDLKLRSIRWRSIVSWTVIGFDAAWMDNARAPGAVCSIRYDHHGHLLSSDPKLASFDQAFDFITAEQPKCDVCVVAIDQPTIVSNLEGMRPVDKVAASLITWLGGGVQPANRSKKGMFDDDAPIWRFKQRLSACDDAEAARSAEQGLFLIEVFPALAIPSLGRGLISA